jgi:hypothetical protein
MTLTWQPVPVVLYGVLLSMVRKTTGKTCLFTRPPSAVNAYWNLYHNLLLFWFFAVENNCKIVTEERGLQDICTAMQSHDSNVDLIESACSALWSLSMEGDSFLIYCLQITNYMEFTRRAVSQTWLVYQHSPSWEILGLIPAVYSCVVLPSKFSLCNKNLHSTLVNFCFRW